jgi:hypothetical protein
MLIAPFVAAILWAYLQDRRDRLRYGAEVLDLTPLVGRRK